VEPVAASETIVLGGRSFVIGFPSDAETRLPGDTVERLKVFLPSALGNGNAKTGAVNAVIGARVEAKDARDFTRADALRAALGSVGVTVKDAKDGATWTVDI
jgi:cysteinyl-tRNA synthetase